MLEEFKPVQEEKVEKEELTETQNESQNEYVDPQKEAKEQLANEEGFEFTQTLTKEDITEMNIFLVKHDSTAFVKRAFLTFVGVLFIVMSIINGDNYYMIALGSIVVIYALVLYNILRVRYVRGRIDKFPPEPLEINVKIGSKYIKYQLTEETDSPLVAFSHVYKVYKNKDYLYLFINRYSIIVLKLNSTDQKEEVLKSIKDRYIPRKAYFEK